MGDQTLEQEADLWPPGTEVGPWAMQKAEIPVHRAVLLEGRLLTARSPALNYPWAMPLQH